MKTRTLLLVICTALLFSIFVHAGNVIEKDDNFAIEFNDETITDYRQINPQASCRDLASFFEELYQKRLSKKLQHGLPLTKVDIMLLREVVWAEGQALGAFGQAFMKDIMDKYPAMSEAEMLSQVKKNDGDEVPEDAKILVHLLVEFRDGRQDRQLRNLITKYAATFKPIKDEAISDDVYCVVKQVYQPFKNPNASAFVKWFFNFSSPELDLQAYEDPYLRPYKAIYPNIVDFITHAEEIGENWNAMYTLVSHYNKLLRRVYREVSGYNSVAKDSRSRRMMEDFLIEQKKEFVEFLKACNMCMVDLPFVFLTKYAYINIQRCKGQFKDNDDGMLAIANAYAISVHGNMMLNDISSAHAANCYVQLIQLLKSELGGDKEGSKFKKFIEQSKLYEINPNDFRNNDYRSRSDE